MFIVEIHASMDLNSIPSFDQFRIASHADVLKLVTRSSSRSWGGTREKPKNVCVGG